MNRRKFLKTIGIGTLGLLIPGSFVPTTASMTSTSNSNNLSTEERPITTSCTYGISTTTIDGNRSGILIHTSNGHSTPILRRERY